jgi:hypothetical protein
MPAESPKSSTPIQRARKAEGKHVDNTHTGREETSAASRRSLARKPAEVSAIYSAIVHSVATGAERVRPENRSRTIF